MRTAVLVLGVAALAVGSPAVGQAPPAPQGVPQDGFWKPESVRFNGEEQYPDAKSREPLVLVIANGEYRMYFMKDAKQGTAIKLFSGAFRPDPATKTFEIEVTDGQRKGLKVHGIYEAAGSLMKLCYCPADKPRPTKFESATGSGHFLEVWTYMNPQPKKAN